MITSATATPEPEKESLSEKDKIEGWRMSQLVRAGYDVASAELLAQRRDVDLHLAAEMLAAGCTVSLAVLILL